MQLQLVLLKAGVFFVEIRNVFVEFWGNCSRSFQFAAFMFSKERAITQYTYCNGDTCIKKVAPENNMNEMKVHRLVYLT